MRIAISATGPSLDAEVDPRFGRCQYFIIVDPETMQYESMENPNVMAGGGAGISTAQMIVNKGAQVVITDNCGPNAYQVLSAAGIQIITGFSGKISDAIQAHKSGQLQVTSQPMGSGMGKGMGMGVGMMSPGSAPQPLSPEQELDALKAQSQTLAQQLSEMQRHIEELEKRRG